MEGGLAGIVGLYETWDDVLPFEACGWPAMEEENGDGVFSLATLVDKVKVNGFIVVTPWRWDSGIKM